MKSHENLVKSSKVHKMGKPYAFLIFFAFQFCLQGYTKSHVELCACNGNIFKQREEPKIIKARREVPPLVATITEHSEMTPKRQQV